MNWMFEARRLRYGVIGILLLLTVAACTWQGVEPDDAGLKRLYISGHSAHVSDQEIARLASPYLQTDLHQVDIEALRQRLASLPWLTDVRVTRHWPDGIVVHVADHKAVAAWGKDSVLAMDGQIFTPEQRPDGLVDLNGPRAKAERIYEQYRRLSGILKDHGVQLAALDLNRRGGWKARLQDGLMLRLGRKHLERRLQRFVHYALERPQARRALATAGYVDLRYSDGFAVGGSRSRTASAPHEESFG